MTRNANFAGRRASRRRALVAGLKAIAIALVVLIASQYFGSFALLWWFHLNPQSASPLTIARFALYYGDNPAVRQVLWNTSLAGFAPVLLAALPLLIPRQPSLHGDARFARWSEIARAGLLAKTGLFLGRVGRRYLMMGGQQGVLLAAPPRAEKGTAIVIPNLLLWPGSLLCLDVKRENWTITAGYRERMGQECFLFHPLAEDGETACWNPLAYVSTNPNHRISDVQRIASILYPDVPGADPFWASGARSYFLGVTMYVLETPSLPPTLGEVLRQGMASDTEGFGHHWRRIIEGRQKGNPLSPQCKRALSEIIDLAPVTASSIRKTFTSRLDLFANPLLDRATSRNDFDLRDLRKRPMSVYLAINPGDLPLLQVLLNLFIEQALMLQTKELPEHNPELKHQVVFMLDEVAAAGRIPILSQGVAYLPGYNVRLFLVIQAFSQLREIYGTQNAETMMKSLAARIVYAPKDMSEATEISQELGFKTVKVNSHSRPAFEFQDAKARRSRSVNTSEQRRPLLLPQEVKELGRDREIVFYEGLRPILARKNRYYRDRVLKNRILPPPNSPVPVRLRARPAATTTKTSATPSPTVINEIADATDAREIATAVVSPSLESTGTGESSAVGIREATIEDVDRIEELTLEDFAADLSKVDIPSEGCVSDREMSRAVDDFLKSLQSR